jgi:hypothetical protein
VGVPGLFGVAGPAGTDGPRRGRLVGRGQREISTSTLRERFCAQPNGFADERSHFPKCYHLIEEAQGKNVKASTRPT